MRIASVVVVATGVLLGCGPVVVPSVVDAGVGGGTATGGGSGGGGGTTTGGGDGTGGGGAQPVCPTLNCAEACVEPTGCVAYFASIEVVTPDAGARVKEGMVSLQARMTPTSGVNVTDSMLPTALSYTAADGGVTQLLKVADTNLYTTSFTLSACGASTEFAGTTSLEDGGLPVATSFFCDGQAPTVTLPTMTNYFQRDDVTVLQLTTSEELDPAMTTATLGGVALERSDAGCTDAGPCFIMDFSKPNFPYIDAGIQLTVTAADIAGLQATVPSQTLKVTRIRWEKTLSPAYGVRAPPAVDLSGNVVVGTADSNTNSQGYLYVLDALTGSFDAGVSIGAIQGVAVANSLVDSTSIEPVAFVSANGGVGFLDGVRLATMVLSSSSPLSVPRAQTPTGQLTYLAPALVMSGVGDGEVLSVATSTVIDITGINQSRVLRWGAATGTDSLTLGSLEGFSRLFHDEKSPPLNAIALQAGQTNAFVRFVGSVGAALRRIVNVRGTPMSVDDGVTIDAGAVSQAGMSGKSFVSIAGAVGRAPQVMRIDAADNSVDWSGTTNNVPVGAVAIGSSSRAFAGSNNSIVTFDPSSNGGTLVDAATFANGQQIALAPVLLAAYPPSSTAWGYSVSSARKLVAFDQTLTAQQWEGVLRSSGTATHPSFSCNTRVGSAKGTGVLFVGWSDGAVQAVVVDGDKLEGPWPKYQRTMGNAGNDDETNFPTNWPGICP